MLSLGPVSQNSLSFVISDLLKNDNLSNYQNIIYIAQGDLLLDQISDILHFLLKDEILDNKIEIIKFPAWDCLPYDRVSVSKDISAERIKALFKIISSDNRKIILTNIKSSLTKVIPQEIIIDNCCHIEIGKELSQDKLLNQLTSSGFTRVNNAIEIGEFAVRGDIVDVVIDQRHKGIRIDFFGNIIENMREFNTVTQLSLGKIKEFDLVISSEIILNHETIDNFKQNYISHFGLADNNDLLFSNIESGVNYAGSNHYLPFFYQERLATIFDYLAPNYLVITDAEVKNYAEMEYQDVQNHYLSRLDHLEQSRKHGSIYNPIKPEMLYLDDKEFLNYINNKVVYLSKFTGELNENNDKNKILNIQNIDEFLLARNDINNNIFNFLKEFIQKKYREKKNYKIIVCCYSEGSRERIAHIMKEYEIDNISVNNYSEIYLTNFSGRISLAILPLEKGFIKDDFIYISEQDLLGEKISSRKKTKTDITKILRQLNGFAEGEIIVHKEHGIGKFLGIKAIDVLGKVHDFLEIIYDGGDKLFVPVENIDLLSKYGEASENIKLDKLGSLSWQERKSKIRNRIKVTAEELIKIAANRELEQGKIFDVESHLLDEFCARFPYTETDDQIRVIDEVIEDLQAGKIMDRLICGDVGFGKTEVAMRASFVVTHSLITDLSAKTNQVVVITPTTLLARQHYKNFSERFKGFNVNIRQLSRLTGQRENKITKEGLENGSVNIVIGTHSLLSNDIKFHNLSLVIIDEEQHFGVRQKEKLKKIKHSVHNLSLSATPIPRSLQMSLSGIKDLSIIASAPLNRLAVRNFVMPYDPLIIREAIIREYKRGGQIFCVAPHIADLNQIEISLSELVPEIKIKQAHGRMNASDLDDIMTDFSEGKFNLLLSTTIIESGIDIATANTIIIFKADKFGLSQLYQLKGRVGRSKIQAYAYFTYSPRKILNKTAVKRLEAIASNEALGSGFSIASLDMDIRGAGNLLGDEQSGNIKEVGLELYQDMLANAIGELQIKRNSKTQKEDLTEDREFSPSVNLGIAVQIPDNYINDFTTKMEFYQRIGLVIDEKEIDEIMMEMVDRFGKIPMQVINLFEIVRIKILCKNTSIDKLEIGEKGAIVRFFNNKVPNPDKLMEYIFANRNSVKLRPDQKLFFTKELKNDEDKVNYAKFIITELNQFSLKN